MQPASFETLRVWHDARRLVAQVYIVTREDLFVRDSGLRDQIRRSAISVMSNIAEGHERGGQREFLHFLRIAKGSAGEVRSQLYAAEDLGLLTPARADELRQQAAVVSREIAALARYRSEIEIGTVRPR
jgi:four helix bundle protein